jgi:glycosyltransferase involved in cell wall biosynthesis
MLITVAICTYNRAESLRRTLDSLAAMRVPDGLDWEVVVVNNNCPDHTDAVIESFADRLPIRPEFEPQGGVSHAKNRAIDVARGDYIIWTDDDVIVDTGWLAAYVEAVRRWPEAALFAGLVTPEYETPPARWIIDSEPFLGDKCFARRNYGMKPLPLSVGDGRLPVGCNFAVRAMEQRAVRYDVELGYKPGGFLAGEEDDVARRLLNAGASGRWVPEAMIVHCIGQERQTIRYLTKRFTGLGEELALLRDRSGALAAQADRGAPLVFGAPRWLWRRYAEGWMRYRIHRLISPPSIWLKHLEACSYVRGEIRYWRSRRRLNEELPLS